MKVKSIIFVISCMFLLGMAGNVLAVTDTTGESLNSGVDILSTSLVTSGIETALPEVANFGIQMAPGSRLPALVLIDVDIDNDTATGGGTVITGIPSASCDGAPCKADAGGGFDFTITLVLRGQKDDTSMSNCSGCAGGNANCATRGTAHTCTEGTCYELGDSCSTGAGCYVAANACECPGDVYAYPLDVLCDDAPEESCSRGFVVGEWRVGYGQTGAVMNGNEWMSSGFAASAAEDICITLPWATIVTRASIQIKNSPIVGHEPFEVSDVIAIATQGPKYQVTALHNVELPWSGTDFTEPFGSCSVVPGFCLAARDWVPNTARVADGEYNEFPPCTMNQEGVYGDIDVDASDVTQFLGEFGREEYYNKCPGCRTGGPAAP